MSLHPIQFPGPQPINAFRGATPAHAEHTRVMVDLCFDLFISAIQGHIDNLRDNTPFNFDGMAYELAQIADARKSISDTLKVVEERLGEDR